MIDLVEIEDKSAAVIELFETMDVQNLPALSAAVVSIHPDVSDPDSAAARLMAAAQEFAFSDLDPVVLSDMGRIVFLETVSSIYASGLEHEAGRVLLYALDRGLL